MGRERIDSEIEDVTINHDKEGGIGIDRSTYGYRKFIESEAIFLQTSGSETDCLSLNSVKRGCKSDVVNCSGVYTASSECKESIFEERAIDTFSSDEICSRIGGVRCIFS